MKREEAETLVSKLESEGIVNLINDEMVRTFGVLYNAKIRVKEDYRRDCYIFVEDQNDDVRKQLTATQLLRQMFTEGEIYMDGYFFPGERGMTESGEDELMLYLHISYRHPDGGGNGLRVGSMLIKLKSKDVKML